MAVPTQDLVQLTEMNPKALAALLVEAKGPSRSMAEYAKACGVNASTLSRILNGKITRPVSVDMLKKLFENRDPSATFTLEQFASANGMVTSEARDNAIEQTRKSSERIYNHYRHISKIITNDLFDRGITMRRIPSPTDEEDEDIGSLLFSKRVHADIALEADYDDHTVRWMFQIVPFIFKKPISDEDAILYVHQIISNFSKLFLRDVWEPNENAGEQYTIVVANGKIYNFLIKGLSNIHFHHTFTAVLVDAREDKVIEETQLGVAEASNFVSLFELSPASSDANYGQASMFDVLPDERSEQDCSDGEGDE